MKVAFKGFLGKCASILMTLSKPASVARPIREVLRKPKDFDTLKIVTG